MINWIRQQFCKHEFEHVQKVKYLDCVSDTYICKKCGWIIKITT